MMTAVGMESRAYSEALTVEAAELSESADVRGEMSCSKLTKFLKDIHILTPKICNIILPRLKKKKKRLHRCDQVTDFEMRTFNLNSQRSSKCNPICFI